MRIAKGWNYVMGVFKSWNYVMGVSNGQYLTYQFCHYSTSVSGKPFCQPTYLFRCSCSWVMVLPKQIQQFAV